MVSIVYNYAIFMEREMASINLTHGPTPLTRY